MEGEGGGGGEAKVERAVEREKEGARANATGAREDLVASDDVSATAVDGGGPRSYGNAPLRAPASEGVRIDRNVPDPICSLITHSGESESEGIRANSNTIHTRQRWLISDFSFLFFSFLFNF